MPAQLRELQARRRAARARRRRRGAVALAAALAIGSGGLAVIVGGAGDGEEAPEVPAVPAPGGSPPSMPASSPQPPAASSPEPSPEATPQPPRLDARRLIGERLIAGYDGLEPPRGLRRMIQRGDLAGVILFEDNIAGHRRTRRAVATLQRIPRPRAVRPPLAVMVDQEGGLVERLSGPPTASAQEMGSRRSAFARRQGAATARSLRRAGINVNLAPVLDVVRRSSAIGAEHRSFARRPAQVITAGVAGFARGLRAGGVAATAKHFPGLGAAEVNTDEASQRIALSRRRLRRVDERPFASFIRAGGELVMLGLATYPAFSNRPAALSRSIASGELRRRLGFEGVSISDSLDASAARSFGGRRRVAIEAARAGTDLLLYGDWRTARLAGRVLRHELLSGHLDRDGFEASAERVLELRRGLGG